MAVTMRELLEKMVRLQASDLHLSAGAPPVLRINQKLVPMVEYPPLNGNDTRLMVYNILTEVQKKKLEEKKELDFAISVPGLSRFRANAFFQRGTVALAVRRIPIEIPSADKLGLPQPILDFTTHKTGLVLVTGPTGSGKSTTLAAMIDKINSERAVHIITIEDPIEYLHKNKRSIIVQREVGQDTLTFANALKYVLRQDPDVIMIGEMRDLETIEAALTAAETGHLVLATLHTSSVAETVNRIIDVFPPHQQDQVRIQISQVLRGAVSQKLLPRLDGKGMVLATEIMIATPAIKTMIRESRIHEIYGVIQTNKKLGMRTMNMSLLELLKKRLISYDVAIMNSPNKEELERMYRQIMAMGR